MRTWANVAKIIKPKKAQGGLVVQSAPGLPFLLREGMEVFFVPPSLDMPRSGVVDSFIPLNDTSAIVHFDSVTTLGEAEQLIGSTCLIKRDFLIAHSEEHTPPSWKGFRVEDEAFGFLGEVDEVIENPAQHLLSVQGERGNILIPLVDEFILVIDEKASQIQTKIPQGLCDLASGGSSLHKSNKGE